MKRITAAIFTLLILVSVFPSGIISQERARVRLDSTAIMQALEVIGLDFTIEEISQMMRGVSGNISNYEQIRDVTIPNSVAPALVFNPFPAGFFVPLGSRAISWPVPTGLQRPPSDTDLAFLPMYELAHLIRTGQVTSTQLTRIYLDRLKKHNDTLLCVVTLTEELALRQAAKADNEIRRGIYRGPLHGIPYGVKDLMAVPGYPTTWGAMPYKDQELIEKATVVTKLEEAGAVLVAKLSSGALAMGDVWFGGTTRNPWNTQQGSSGSSAGPASATAAGLVAFALGTETLGSIVSPSTRCGVTGLRPTYGRVSKYGTMALSWSMDKIGPICRTSLDCAMVLSVIQGQDPLDPSTVNAGFGWLTMADLSTLRIGYLKEFFDTEYAFKKNDSIALETFRELGANLTEVTLPRDLPVSALRIILNAEAAAAFDELTRSNRDSLLVSQGAWAWPNSFRTARLIPAVEYIQANRVRSQLIEQTNKWLMQYDLIIAPSFGGDQMTLTNLTGHPCLCVPTGFDEKGNPTSISLIGNLLQEGLLCSIGYLYQEKTGYYRMKPPKFAH